VGRPPTAGTVKGAKAQKGISKKNPSLDGPLAHTLGGNSDQKEGEGTEITTFKRGGHSN